MNFEAFYRGDLQGLYALLIAPLGFLVWRAFGRSPGRGADASAAPFVASYCLVFAVETTLDPLATGPLAAALGGGAAATLLGLAFVLLGDFRVFLLILHVASRERRLAASVARAALYTPIVPLLAYGLVRLLGTALGELPTYVLYLCHELLFVAMVAVLWVRVIGPASAHHGAGVLAFLRAVALYVGVYYALWASADVLILLGLDAGFGLRVVPNQLYYGFFVPFVYLAFFRRAAVSPGP